MTKNTASNLRKSQPSPEELRVKRQTFAENVLFAVLGGICAIVVGLAWFGELKSMHTHQRVPASTDATHSSDTSTLILQLDER